MDIERPHRTTNTPTASELFICFTSSMRLSSKSILSPGRAGDKSSASLSLTTSLSRRLRHNGSLRGGGAGGGQSPAMFSSSKKNRGCSGFENPEPSSPKVTCIGQVRVKTRKQGKKMKMRACRSKSKRLSSGEASFRRIESAHEGLTHQNSQGIQNQPMDCSLPHRNQRWVHLPLTICEALRGLGSEFSCLFPCKSSCFSSCSNEREKEEKGSNSNPSSSCGAVCRWLVAWEGEGEGKGRDIELVVGREEREGREKMVMERDCSRRRSIFDDMEFKDEIFDTKKGNDNGEEDEVARVSVCIPPKNALMLMRCRSDPMKMSALSQKIWEAPVVAKDFDDDDDEEEEEVGEVKEKTEVSEEMLNLGEVCKEIDEMCEDLAMVEENVIVHEMGSQDLAMVEENIAVDEMGSQDLATIEENVVVHEMGCQDLATIEENVAVDEMGFQDLAVSGKQEQKPEETEHEETEKKKSKEDIGKTSSEEEIQLMGDQNQPISALENVEDDTKEQDLEERERVEESSDLSSSSSGSTEESTAESHQEDSQEEEEILIKSMEEEEEEEEEEEPPLEDCQQTLTHLRSEPGLAEEPKEEKENESKWEKGQKEINDAVLPDCLLLMMCEPKLSMEVSKETWVCSTDFIRWLPERHPNKKPTKIDGSDEPKKKKKATPPPPLPPLPPAVEPPVQVAVQQGRSSISFPTGGGSVANLIEKKMVKAGVGYEPFALTRCKSAPMRSTAKIAPPEMACSLWRRDGGRKMEPLRPSVGASGVGF